MNCHRDQRLGLVTHGLIFENEILSGQLTLTSHVIPETDGGVVARARRDDGPLNCNIEPIDPAIVEATANQLELDLVVHGVGLPYALRPHQADIIVL